MPLFDWKPVPQRPAARLVLLHCLPDPDGLPRPALLMPGRRVPIPYRNLAAAHAALRSMEVAR